MHVIPCNTESSPSRQGNLVRGHKDRGLERFSKLLPRLIVNLGFEPSSRTPELFLIPLRSSLQLFNCKSKSTKEETGQSWNTEALVIAVT
jgi:hypothetical protein